MKKDYSNYDWADFLEDENFLEWMKDPNGTQKSYWESLIHENPSVSSSIEAAKEAFHSIKYKDLSSDLNSKQKIWESIQKSVQEPKPSKLVKFWPYLLTAAASVSLVIYFTLFNTESIHESAPMAEQKLVRLPDSSFITLNAASEVSYDPKSYNKNRRIKLKGEAYFQVKKGEKFTVITELGEVNVLGTSFNVYSRNNLMNVSCLAGKVVVHFFSSKNQYILTPGMSVKSEDLVIQNSTFNLEDFKFWRDGYFYYENAPLIQVMQELQRQYNLTDIKYSNNLLKYRYTGFFKRFALDDAMQSVFLPLKLRANVSNGVLSVKE
ncbi:MAG: FecR family protein [Saprospiraceae bacterium]